MNLKEENDKLRELLRRVYSYVPIPEQVRIDAALSQQAEPAAVNQCDGCQAGVPVDNKGNHRMGKPGGYADVMRCEKARYVSEPAPVQDEREAFERSIQAEGGLISVWGIGRKGDSYEYPPIAARYDSFKAGAEWERTRTAKTEQQPIRLPQRKPGSRNEKPYADAHYYDWVEDPEGDSWNAALDEVARLNAAPVAQTEQQPVALQPDCDAVAVCGCRIVQSRKLGNVIILCAAHTTQVPAEIKTNGPR